MQQTIGKYQVIRQLGAGGFGAVYLCEDPLLKEQVAVKVFQVRDAHLAHQATSASGDASRILRERFLAEARVLRKLSSNPNIVEVYDFGEAEDGTPFYVMPYLGKSLVDEIGKDAMDPAVIAELPAEFRPRRMATASAGVVLTQLINALSAVHKEGLIHRDIKPANILFNADGVVQLCDFGIAKVPDAEHSQTSSGLAMGSRNYMAPEQRESAKHVDARADVYAVGVLAYRMYTGTLPVGRYEDPVVLCPSMGKVVSDWILACLEQDKARRPADGMQLRQSLGQTLKAAAVEDSGAEATDEHSGTWVEEGQGEGRYKASVSPLEQRIEELLLTYAEVPKSAEAELKALAAVGNIGPVALEALIAQISARLEHQIGPRRNFLQYVDQTIQSGQFSDEMLAGLVRAGQSVGFDGQKIRAIIEQRVSQAKDVHSAEEVHAPPKGVSDRRKKEKLPLWIFAVAGVGALMFGGAFLQPQIESLLKGGGDTQIALPMQESQSEPPTQASSDNYQRPQVQPTLDAVAQLAAAERERREQEKQQRAEQEARTEREIESLSGQFEAQLTSFKLTKPQGDNAAETLERLRELSPEHPKAIEGAARLAGKYLQLFERDLGAGKLPKASGYIKLAEGFTPESPLIAEARAKLETAQQEAEQALAAASLQNSSPQTQIPDAPVQNPSWATGPSMGNSRFTPVGAERAGNADGSIPAWQGGLAQRSRSGGRYTEPSGLGGKQFSITSSNYRNYRDKLTAGQIAMFEKYPSYRMDVYPTQRTASFPSSFYDATLRNRGQARVVGGGIQGHTEGIPFLNPGSGAEVVLNHQSRIPSLESTRVLSQALVGEYGVKTAQFTEQKKTSDSELLSMRITRMLSPSRIADQMSLEKMARSGRFNVWLYNPGLGRVNRAPDVGFDNPYIGSDGEFFCDQLDGYSGDISRYDWRLVGKKEIYIPYNSYSLMDASLTSAAQKWHLSPRLLRYELHRVWVVEARIRSGSRHQLARRVMYFDEDSWGMVLADGYDNRGQLWKVQENHLFNAYEVPFVTQSAHVVSNLQTGRYFVTDFIEDSSAVRFSRSGQFPDGHFSASNLKRLARER